MSRSASQAPVTSTLLTVPVATVLQKRATPAAARRGIPTAVLVALIACATIPVRLLVVGEKIHPDEAGYLLVAQSWHLGGPNLYGPYWVDRPPLLIALFKLAVLTGHGPAIRLVALPLIMVGVGCAGWAAHQVAGRRAAIWAAALAAALLCSPLLSVQVDGEMLAAPFVLASMALTLAAVRRSGGASYWLAALAGVVGGTAMLVKQNFWDGLVFAVVLVVASAAFRHLRVRHAAGLLGAGVAGLAVPVLAAAGYAELAGVGVGELWFDLFGFRSEAFSVILGGDLHETLVRARQMPWLALASGILPLVLLLAYGAVRHRSGRSPVGWALGVTLALGVAGIVLGGGYWPHYLVELAPPLALAAGIWAERLRGIRPVIVGAVVSTLVVSAGVLAHDLTTPISPTTAVGRWLHAVGRPGDTLTVLYGSENLQREARMSSPYPYLWALPLRVLDPHLDLLKGLLASRQAPTWVVVTGGVDKWGLDEDASARLVLTTHYHPVGVVCERHVWLRDGVQRTLVPRPTCEGGAHH